MTDYYVSKTGSDSNDGRSLTTAWATPTHAALQAQAGDVINLLAGVWQGEHVTFANSGTPNNPITMRGVAGASILDGVDGTGLGIVAGSYTGTWNPSEWITVERITVRNYHMQIITRRGSNIRILGCVALPDPTLNPESTPAGIIIGEGCNNCTIEGCSVIGDSYPIGVTGRTVSGDVWSGEQTNYVQIKNCIVHGNETRFAINTAGNIDNLLIENNVLGRVTEPNRGGFASSQGVLTNLTFSDNSMFNCARDTSGGQAILLTDVKGARIERNLIDDTSTGVKIRHADYGVDDTPDDILLLDNTIRGAGDNGIFVYASATNIVAEGNVFSDIIGNEFRFASPGIVRNHNQDSFRLRVDAGVEVQAVYNDGRSFDIDGVGTHTTHTFTTGIYTLTILGETPPTDEARIYVTSTPPNAVIAIDGVDTGDNTPSDADHIVSVGMHTLNLSLSGYNDWEEARSLIANQRWVVAATLIPVAPPTQTICTWLQETGIGNLTVSHALYNYYLSMNYTNLAEMKYSGLSPQPARLAPANVSIDYALGTYYYGMGYMDLGDMKTGCTF